MKRLLKKNALLLASLGLAWFSWSTLDVEKADDADAENPFATPETLPSIGERFLGRPEGTPSSVKPEDPFRLVARATEALEAEEESAAVPGEGDPESAAPKARSVKLRLESTLKTGSGGIARLSGVTVRQGETIPGIDEENPPVLEKVSGTGASVRHRGTLYLLDMAGDREVLLVWVPAGR